MTELKKDTMQRMQKFYPEALHTALASYHRVSRKIEKKYVDHKQQQEACRVSVEHIKLLLKLGKELIQDGKAGGMDAVAQEDLRALIERAQEEIKNI
ncbi:MAG: hypothetical protein OEY94_06370 [Alphaproteobacteria bacterium]|nr:hypothetical protein [Alphaproteobacteria bacterium]